MSEMDSLTEIAFDWGVRAFGEEHMLNRPTRALRLAEEAIELAQAVGVEQTMMHKLVDDVYARPEGNVLQELSGVILTTAVLCRSFRIPMEKLLLRELCRVLAKPPEHFAERNLEKLDLGLDAGRVPDTTPLIGRGVIPQKAKLKLDDDKKLTEWPSDYDDNKATD